MTSRNQPHKFRCETCAFNKETADCGCPAWQFNKFLVPIIGCASHSDATKAEQRIADLELALRSIVREIDSPNDWETSLINIKEKALALLREKEE